MKRIVICADGTWNTRDQVDEKTGQRKPSNVTKLARTVLSRTPQGVDQVVYYHEGIGTRSGMDKFTGGAFGQGMCSNVRDLYRFIVYNYENGDELYLFGFSRGAFTVRTLCGFMYRVGLLEKRDDYYTPEIYGIYEKSLGPLPEGWRERFKNIKRIRPCPPIHFVGVWDTVGALGAPGFFGQVFGRKRYQFHDIELNPEIRNAFQALAVDERRRPFAPSIWSKPAGWSGRLEQAWFPGVHSNIGGGYHPDGLANEALHWIVEKAESAGLEFDIDVLKLYEPCFNSELRNSMSFMYWLMWPKRRGIELNADNGARLHQASIDRWNHFGRYRPKNLQSQMQTGRGKSPAAQTTRIARGKPCPPLPKQKCRVCAWWPFNK